MLVEDADRSLHKVKRSSDRLRLDDPDRPVAGLDAPGALHRLERRPPEPHLLAVELGDRAGRAVARRRHPPRAHLVVDLAPRLRPVDERVLGLELAGPACALLPLWVAAVAAREPFERLL